MRLLKELTATLIICLFSINFNSCSSEKIIVQTKIDTIKIIPKPLSDTVNMRISAYAHDTIYVYDRIIKNDTIIKFKFYPKERKLYYYVKPDTIKLLRTDTVYNFGIKKNDGYNSVVSALNLILAAALLLVFSYLTFLAVARHNKR